MRLNTCLPKSTHIDRQLVFLLEWMNERTNEWMNEWLKEWLNTSVFCVDMRSSSALQHQPSFPSDYNPLWEQLLRASNSYLSTDLVTLCPSGACTLPTAASFPPPLSYAGSLFRSGPSLLGFSAVSGGLISPPHGVATRAAERLASSSGTSTSGRMTRDGQVHERPEVTQNLRVADTSIESLRLRARQHSASIGYLD